MAPFVSLGTVGNLISAEGIRKYIHDLIDAIKVQTNASISTFMTKTKKCWVKVTLEERRTICKFCCHHVGVHATGCFVGKVIGTDVGEYEGAVVGGAVVRVDGTADFVVGDGDGRRVGLVGRAEGKSVGSTVGRSVGTEVGRRLGTFEVGLDDGAGAEITLVGKLVKGDADGDADGGADGITHLTHTKNKITIACTLPIFHNIS